MQFRVPKYLEREATIAFGLTFKSLGIFGGAGLVLFVLYYVTPKIIFVVIALVLVGSLLAFTFIKIKGESLFQVFTHASNYFFSSRMFLWQKKPGFKTIKLIKKKRKKEEEKKTSLRIAPGSRLNLIRSKIDLGSKELANL